MNGHRWRKRRWTVQYVCVRCGTIDGPVRWFYWLVGRDRCGGTSRAD